MLLKNTKRDTTSHPAETFNASNILSAGPANAPANHWDKLSTEMRLKIYGYVLADELGREEIYIEVVMHKDGRRPELFQEKPRASGKSKDKRRGAWDRKTMSYLDPIPPRTAILSVDRNIQAEALQVLYGTGTFTFRNTREMKTFLALIGPGVQYLRAVRVELYIKKHAVGALQLLSQAVNLRKLEFYHIEFCCLGPGDSPPWKPFVTKAHIVQDCKPLLKVLHASYRAQNLCEKTANVLDVLTLAPQWCFRCLDTEKKSELMLRGGEREALAKELGIEEGDKESEGW